MCSNCIGHSPIGDRVSKTIVIKSASTWGQGDLLRQAPKVCLEHVFDSAKKEFPSGSKIPSFLTCRYVVHNTICSGISSKYLKSVGYRPSARNLGTGTFFLIWPSCASSQTVKLDMPGYLKIKKSTTPQKQDMANCPYGIHTSLLAVMSTYVVRSIYS